jgi:chromate reductase
VRDSNDKLKVLVFAASSRKESSNKKLINLAAKFVQKEHIVDSVDFLEFDTPLYNGDIEEKTGIPQPALSFIDKLESSDCLIMSSPEYNFSVPGSLKNLIDWVSRKSPMPWKNVPILLMSASPSLAGGSRGLLCTRVPLEVCGAYVYPKMFSLSNCYEAFDEEGQLKDKKNQEYLLKVISNFLAFAKDLLYHRST